MDQSDCIKNPNFVVIYSFIQKFANFLSIPKYTLKQLEDNIVNSSEEICQLQQYLLKKIYKSMRTEFWERNLAKFTDNLTDDEISYLNQKEYYKLSIASKLNILKNLLESQFDDNNDLKNDLLNREGDSLREFPIGHDNLGSFYWFQQDIDGNIYLYKENNQNQLWELICHERKGLLLTIESLKSVYDNLIGKLTFTEPYVNESSNKDIDGEPKGNNIKYSNDNKDLHVYCNGDSASLDNLPQLNEPKSNSEKPQLQCSTPTQDLSKMDNDTKEPLEDGRRVLRQSIRRAGNKIQNLMSQTSLPMESSKTKKPKTYNRCTQCGKTKPSAVLTCLDCLAFYHPTCLPQTYLIVDEETPWYCPICQHKRLIAALEAKLTLLDSFTETQRQLTRKKERLAIAGINIANILDNSKETLGHKFGAAPQASDLSKISTLTGIRSCRIKKHISYQFDEYDKLMDKAIKEQNNADPKSAIRDSAAPTLRQQKNIDSDSSYASTRQETSSPRLAERTLPKSQTQSRQHEPLATSIEPSEFESYFAPPSQTHRLAASPVSPALQLDIRPRRNRRRPDRFDEQMGEEDRRYGVSSSDSSEFEYGYKPRKTTRSRRHKLDRNINAKPNAFDDGYFMSKSHQAIRTKGASETKKDYGTIAGPTLPNEPLHQLAIPEPRPDAPNPSLMTRLVSDDAGQALSTAPISYYKPPPTPKTHPQADSHPLLNLCHMTSLYPGPTRAPTLTPTPSPLPKTLVVRPRARPPSNCIILPVLNSGNGLLVRPPGGPRTLTSPPHPVHRQTGLVPEPSITVIEVNALLNNVIPKTSIW